METLTDPTTTARMLGVQEATIKKILSGRKLCSQSYIKIRQGLSRNNIAFEIKLKEKEEDKTKLDLQEGCRNFLLSNPHPLDLIAKQFHTQESTLKKIAQGKSVNLRATLKVEKLISEYKAGPIKINYESEKLKKMKDVYQLYCEHGTLQAVGDLLNLTRERIRQILVKGTRLGLFTYRGWEYPYISKEQILSSYKKHLILRKVAQEFNISSPYLKNLLTAHQITQIQLQHLYQEGQKLNCIDRYCLVSKTFGRDATSTDLQKSNQGRYLYNKITKLWGGIDNFRTELGIQKPIKENFGAKMRPWREKKQRLAVIMRMQHLDMIRESLSNHFPQPISLIARSCNLPAQRTYRLLQLLINSGEVVSEGRKFTTCYKLT